MLTDEGDPVEVLLVNDPVDVLVELLVSLGVLYPVDDVDVLTDDVDPVEVVPVTGPVETLLELDPVDVLVEILLGSLGVTFPVDEVNMLMDDVEIVLVTGPDGVLIDELVVVVLVSVVPSLNTV